MGPMEGSQTQGQTVLVTGGSGFLGSWCAIELLRQGYKVRTTVRDLSREPAVRAAIASQVDAGDRLSVLAADLRAEDAEGYVEKAKASMAEEVDAMLVMKKRGAEVFDYGNNIRACAVEGGCAKAFDIPGFVPAYIRPLFCVG